MATAPRTTNNAAIEVKLTALEQDLKHNTLQLIDLATQIKESIQDHRKEALRLNEDIKTLTQKVAEIVTQHEIIKAKVGLSGRILVWLGPLASAGIITALGSMFFKK